MTINSMGLPVYVDESGDLCESTGECLAIDFGAEDEAMQDIAVAVNYHDRLVEALDNSMNTVEAMLAGFKSVNAENCIRESAALLAELSAHNGGEG